MHIKLILLSFFVGTIGLSQKFDIAPAKFPYSDIIEWKGMGALLVNKDPSGNEKQIHLTLVGNQTTSIWDQKFTPKNEEYYYVSSENARYVYFMDNLELRNGKVYFSQLNSAGNVKSTGVSIASAIKKIGNYDYDKLELINIIVTDKALVHHFRYNDKKNKSIVEIATFITHHNFLCYAVTLGSIPLKSFKEPGYGYWEYTGFTEDQIYFAARDVQNKTNGWSVKQFSSKGKIKQGYFFEAPNGLLPIENIGFGTTGKYYLKEKFTIESGLLTFMNSKFYLVGAQRREKTGAELTLFEYKEAEWLELNSMKLNYFIEKKNLKLGIYPMNEGIGYHLDHNGYDKVSLISFIPGNSSSHNDFTERTIFNPSSVFERKKKEEFNVILPEGLLVFNTNQLGQKGAVIFEMVKK